MHSYRVIDRREDESRLALQCAAGQYHLTRVLNLLPPAGATLQGGMPRVGFGLLQCPASGAIFRVIFESINKPDLQADLAWSRSTSHAAQLSNDRAFGVDD